MFARPLIATATVLAIAALLYFTAAATATDRPVAVAITDGASSIGAPIRSETY